MTDFEFSNATGEVFTKLPGTINGYCSCSKLLILFTFEHAILNFQSQNAWFDIGFPLKTLGFERCP